MTWQMTYPTIATVNMAHVQTLRAWRDNLPAPQTDVEQAVRRRIHKRINDHLREEIEAHPDIRERFNDILDRMEKLGIPIPDEVERL